MAHREKRKKSTLGAAIEWGTRPAWAQVRPVRGVEKKEKTCVRKEKGLKRDVREAAPDRERP